MCRAARQASEHMKFLPLGPQDRELVEAATEVLIRNYLAGRHTVGAAILCSSGRVYTGINVETCGYGPCAEPIAIGAAFSHGERDIVAMVAVCKRGSEYPVLSPCGNCRQLLVGYAPEAMVIFVHDGEVVKARALDLLPGAYTDTLDAA